MTQCPPHQLAAFAIGGSCDAARIDNNNIRCIIYTDDAISVSGKLFSDGSSFCIVELAAEGM
jgi:hypothetical protein